MIYGYARVATDAQDLTNQVARLMGAGCMTIFREKISGATAERPQLRKPMTALTHGDVVVIPAVGRLSCDTTDLLVIARDMQRAGAGLRSLAEPVVDTTSDLADLVLALLGVAAKLERRRIIERTARGRADAKAKGVQFGRKPKLTPQPAARSPRTAHRLRDTAQHRPQLQRQPDDDFEANSMTPQARVAFTDNWPMIRRYLPGLLILLWTLLPRPSGAETYPSLIVIDRWWGIDYAKGDCFREGKNESVCNQVKISAYNIFELEFKTKLSANTGCYGIQITSFGYPEKSGTPSIDFTSRPHWFFSINYIEGQAAQFWQMTPPDGSDLPLMQASGTVSQIAQEVCTIVKGKGGAVIR